MSIQEYFTQSHFLNLVPFDRVHFSTLEKPIYPLFQVINDEFLNAKDFICRKYVPHFNGLDGEEFLQAKEWIKKSDRNIKLFNNAGFSGGMNLDLLPDVVQKYHSSILLQLELFLSFIPNGELLGRPVMYRANSQNWESDILLSTRNIWQNLRLHPYEPKEVNMNMISTTRSLRLIYNLYNGLGDPRQRDIAADDMSSILFRSYFNHVIKRANDKSV